MGNTNSNTTKKHAKHSSSLSNKRKHAVSSSSNNSSTQPPRVQSPLSTVSSLNLHPPPTTTTVIINDEQQDQLESLVIAPSHALIGIGASSSRCSFSNHHQRQQTPSSPILLSSATNTSSFNIFPLNQHVGDVDSDMTSTCTTSRRNSRSTLNTSIHIQNCTETTNISTTTIHIQTPTNPNESSLNPRKSLPNSSTAQSTTRLQENTGYKRSLSTPKLSLLKKKNVIKAFFMLHRRNTVDEAEMKGEEEFVSRRRTDGEEYIPNVSTTHQIIDNTPPQLPIHRIRVHSMTISAITSDSSSSATKAGADTDTDTTIAAEQDEKKKIANILNKSFSKTRNVIKSQPHLNHVEIPSSDHGKLPSERKNLERSASAPQIMTNELELLLRDAMGFQLFKDFCVAEFSVENLNCWQELLDMEKNFIDMSGKRRSKVINMVYDKFLDDGSTEEINIRGKTKKLVDNERKSGTINLDTSKQILHEIKRDLYTNLVDSFSRFIYTEEYKLWHELKTNPSNVFE